MTYEQPEVRDYGDLIELTNASGVVGAEDGTGKSITVVVDPLVEATIQLFP